MMLKNRKNYSFIGIKWIMRMERELTMESIEYEIDLKVFILLKYGYL